MFALHSFCFGSCASIFAFAVYLFQQSSPTNTLPDLTVDPTSAASRPVNSWLEVIHHTFKGGAGGGAA